MNCYSCFHKVGVNKALQCDRRLLIDGVIVSVKNPDAPCPCHHLLDLEAEETREGFGSLKRSHSWDSCNYCGKIVKEENDFQAVKGADGSRTKACKCCVEKGVVG